MTKLHELIDLCLSLTDKKNGRYFSVEIKPHFNSISVFKITADSKKYGWYSYDNADGTVIDGDIDALIEWVKRQS